MKEKRFVGGRGALIVSLVLGVGGLGGSFIAIGLEPARGLYAYLFAFSYWVGIAVGALMLLTIWHAAQARWPTLLRRVLETICSTLAIFPILFVPILAGSAEIFPFRSPEDLDEQLHAHIEHQHPYSNIAFWCIRAAAYFALWIGVSERLRAWSARQDRDPNLKWTLQQRRLGVASLPVIAFFISFAALDWVMALDPKWSSTIFGLYFFTGSFLAAIALLTMATILLRGPTVLGNLVNSNHLASLGKMMLAFTCFWAYIAFDQYMLVWIANISGENDWYIVRTSGTWGGFAIAILIGQFVVPFFLLLSRELKMQRPWLLFSVAAFILVAHALDVYWMVIPAIDREGVDVHWEDPIAFVGVGGIVLAMATWRLRGSFLYPIRDPYLEESIRYSGE